MLREKPAHLNAPSPGGSATGLSAIPRHGSSRWLSRRTEMQVAATGASSCMSPAVQKGPLGDLHAKLPIHADIADEGGAGELVVGDVIDLQSAGIGVAQQHVAFATARFRSGIVIGLKVSPDCQQPCASVRQHSPPARGSSSMN